MTALLAALTLTLARGSHARTSNADWPESMRAARLGVRPALRHVIRLRVPLRVALRVRLRVRLRATVLYEADGQMFKIFI